MNTRSLKNKQDIKSSQREEWDEDFDSDDVNSDLEDSDDGENEELEFSTLSGRHQSRLMDELDSLSREFLQENKTPKVFNSARSFKTTSTMSTMRDFDAYYEKSCVGFLNQKNKKLEKERRIKEDMELSTMLPKPILTSRPATRPHIPLLERGKINQVRKEREIEKIRKEREQEEQKEYEKLPFRPKLNEVSEMIASEMDRPEIIERLYRNVQETKCENIKCVGVCKNKAKPEISEISNLLSQRTIQMTSSDVVERLFIQGKQAENRKEKLIKKYDYEFTPTLTKNTIRIAEQLRHKCCNDEAEVPEVKLKLNETSFPSFQSSSNLTASSIFSSCSGDDKILNNLKQLTQLLQKDNRAPNTAR